MDYDKSIHYNPDAQAWAKLFIEMTKDKDREVFRDEGYMISWFANAMMAMHDHLMGIKILNGDHAAALQQKGAEADTLAKKIIGVEPLSLPDSLKKLLHDRWGKRETNDDL